MTQHQKVDELKKRTHENQYEKYCEEDLLHVLLNIAESLAIIADKVKEK